jgi:acyl dehydratase
MGLYYEDLHEGAIITHKLRKTVTEGEHHLFCAITLNPQPLHIDEHFAAHTEFGTRLVNGLYTLSLVVGITVNDLTLGTIVANLGYESITHPHPVTHGDTLSVETEIISKRLSKSRPNAGIVTMTHTGHNQEGVVVITVTRSALFLRKEAADA